MHRAVRLALSTAATLALVLVLTRIESNFTALIAVLLNVALVGAVAGVIGQSSPLSALSVVIGGIAGLYISMFMGVQLWNPSPIASDLMVIRLLMLGGAAGVAAISGYALRVRPAEKPIQQPAAGPSVTEVSAPGVEKAGEVEVISKSAEQVEVSMPTGRVEVQTRICKFCASVIPAESVFCPMCGNKLVEV